MAFTDADRVRRLVGETIPEDGTDDDTMFSDAQIADFLEEAEDHNVTRATLEAWKSKAGEYANLVDVSEGNSQRKMSDLHMHALEMVKLYQGLVEDLDETDDNDGKVGRVVIGTISRRGQYR